MLTFAFAYIIAHLSLSFYCKILFYDAIDIGTVLFKLLFGFSFAVFQQVCIFLHYFCQMCPRICLYELLKGLLCFFLLIFCYHGVDCLTKFFIYIKKSHSLRVCSGMLFQLFCPCPPFRQFCCFRLLLLHQFYKPCSSHLSTSPR